MDRTGLNERPAPGRRDERGPLGGHDVRRPGNPAAPANGLGRLCEYDDCDQLALPGDDWCAEHKAEHDQLMAEEFEPGTTTELAQAVTAQLESATLAAQYTAANDARREG